jgi:hypothetical protein
VPAETHAFQVIPDLMVIAEGAPYFVACRIINSVGGEKMVMVREILLGNYLRSGEK